MTILYGDLETYSPINLKTHGTHAYAEKAEVMLFPYAIDDGPVKCWDAKRQFIPKELADALLDPAVLTVWQNGGMFDLTIMRPALPIYALPHNRVFDVLACALAHSLPAGLGQLCEVFKIAEDKAKHKTGQQLIQLFCKPRPRNSKIKRATAETHPEEWEQFIEYAKSDISSMREIYKKIPKWNYNVGHPEYDLWLLDQKINMRGVAVDLELATRAMETAEQAKKDLAEKAHAMTEGAVDAATQRDKLLEHILEAYGISLPDMQMATLERRMADPDIPEPLKELLSVRLQATTTSVSKYRTLIRATSSDGRLRGLLQFAGAMRTGRWAGRTFQPHNLMRPTISQERIEVGIQNIKGGVCRLVYDDVMQIVSNCVRGCLIAPPGKRLVVADLSNIEGRAAAWLAGEAWKLKAFERYDDGVGADLYCIAYGKSFNVDPNTVSGLNRQIGKVQELMLQYEGGVGAFVTGAATYKIDLDEMAEKAFDTIPKRILEEAENFWEWTVEENRPTYGLHQHVFVVCDSLKRLWREAHPMISSYWRELQSAYIKAINNPGTTIKARMLSFRRDGAWLRIKLPSGRFLCYPAPQHEAGTCSYMGLDQYTKQWTRISTYGGKLFENICQAVSRDVMAAAMQPTEDAGFEIVLTVHDELVTEAPDTDEYSSERLGSILAAPKSWTTGLPLNAAGYVAQRYRKD